MTQTDIVVHFRAWEMLLVWRRQVRVPIRQVRLVQLDDEPLSHLRCWRAPGLYWPGAVALGTGRAGGTRDLAAVRAGRPAVVIEVEGGRWQRVTISSDKAPQIAAELAAYLLTRGPGGAPGGRPGGSGWGRSYPLQRSRPRTGRPSTRDAAPLSACPRPACPGPSFQALARRPPVAISAWRPPVLSWGPPVLRSGTLGRRRRARWGRSSAPAAAA